MTIFRKILTMLVAALAIVASAVPAVAARYYVDNALGTVAQRAALSQPGPVQVLVEFQTNGVRNEKATREARKLVMAELPKLPYLSQISDKPVASGALLTVKINNIFSPEERKRVMKAAFKTGLTFGAADTIVRDNYTLSFSYVPATAAPAISSTVNHVLVTTLGKGSDQSYGVEYKKPIQAVSALIGQSLDHGLDAIARKVAT